MENMVMQEVNPLFWKNRKVFLTGHTGFKGSWLSLWLQKMGAKVCGYALEPNTVPNLFTQANVIAEIQNVFADIRDGACVLKTMQSFQPDLVIHMAAQPLVGYSYHHPVETYDINVMGTVHVLEAARHTETVRAVINVTSDKCYAKPESIWGHREDEPMGGYDPYSNSKGCSELVTSAYRDSFFLKKSVGVASVRAGNVIGGGDWAVDRLVPDVIRACMSKKNLIIRYPQATRPWQHVLEPLSGYLLLAQLLYEEPEKFSQGWNFGPHHQESKSVRWIVDTLISLWGKESITVLDDTPKLYEVNSLKLDCEKAATELNWLPQWDLPLTLQKIVAWYSRAVEEKEMRQYTLQQIDEYQSSWKVD